MPIVSLGEVIGVLVVQATDEREFDSTDTSFLVTIAAQLAGNLFRYSLDRSTSLAPSSERVIRGQAAAPGQRVGTLHPVLDRQTLNLVDVPPPKSIESELKSLRAAIHTAQHDMAAAKLQFDLVLEKESLSLFDIYSELLANDQLVNESEKLIRDGSSAFTAVRQTVDNHVAMFEAINDEYLRGRAEDIRHVGDKLLTTILQHASDPTEAAAVILIGETVSITDIAKYKHQQLAGIVCLAGSSYSHTVLLARALGIPAVIATGPIDHISEGDTTIIDGDEGSVILKPGKLMLAHYQEQIEASRFHEARLLELKNLPAQTKDKMRITLLANTGLTADISPGIERGAEGIGLYRSEIPFLTRASFPTELEQVEIYASVLSRYAPMPVTMRTLDIGGDKALPYLKLKEDNPALGWRGIRFSLDNLSVFMPQLRAMLKANQKTNNLKIMLPMVHCISQVRIASNLLDECVEQLNQEGCSIERPKLGIMVEVPAIIGLLPDLIEYIEFISVGTNDLTQYLLAADRTNLKTSKLYDYLHPSVLRTLSTIVLEAQRSQLDFSVCGEMAANPSAALVLIGMGFRTLSMNAFSLPRVKAMVRGVTIAHAQEISATALAGTEPQQIRARLNEQLDSFGYSALFSGS